MMRTAYPKAETLHRMLRTKRDASVIGKILAVCQTSTIQHENLNEQRESIAMLAP
jgi:hypothetical protein